MYEVFSKQDAKKFMDAFIEGVMDRNIVWLPTSVMTLLNKIEYHERKLQDESLNLNDQQEFTDRSIRYQAELEALKSGQVYCRPSYFTIVKHQRESEYRQYNIWNGKKVATNKIVFPLEVNVSFTELTKPVLKFNYRQMSRSTYYSLPERELTKLIQDHPIWLSFYSLISREQLVFDHQELEAKAYVIEFD